MNRNTSGQSSDASYYKSLMTKILLFLIYIVFCKSIVAQEPADTDSCCIKNTVPYYNIDAPLKYTGGFYALKSFIREKYNTNDYTKLSGNTGIIVVHFNVSCKGETKNVEVKSFDLNYKKTIMNPSITEELRRIVSELKKWEIGKDEHNNPYCYHKFLAIKLIDGEIVEILPN